MSNQNNKLKTTGALFSSLAIGLIIGKYVFLKDSQYGFAISILAVILAFIGFYLVNKAKKMNKNNQ